MTRRGERRRGIVILVHQDPEKRKYVDSPDVVSQAEIEPTALVWDETAACATWPSM
jgi:hypothetical protein